MMNTDKNKKMAEGNAPRVLSKAELPLGTRVRLTREVDRYPHFIAKAGMCGTVVQHGTYAVCVRMDAFIPEAKDWDNEIEWFEDSLPHFVCDTERLFPIHIVEVK